MPAVPRVRRDFYRLQINMSVKIFATIVLCFLYHIDCGQCFIEWPIAVVVGVIAGSVCRFKECCTDEYIPGDLDLLKYTLKTELHDQHLAVQSVEAALKHHINNTEPEKALAISFHGSTGTGKNLMVNLIVDAIYKKKEESNYVHHYNGHLEFSSKEKVAEYQHQVEKDILNHLGSCPRSIFIFNEVDHMPKGMLDALLPFLDYNPRLLSVDPTRAIFIFVSNIGASSIEEKLTEMWQAGKKREETVLRDFQSLLANSAFHGPGGFQQSNVVKMDFIDYYIPFLPFEKIHVRKCIEAALKKNNMKVKSDFQLSEMIDEIMAHMTFLPPPHNLYSQSGCKRVASKVSAVIERNRLTNPFIGEN